MFDIESNIPIPLPARRNKRKSKYPLATIDVGQSFFIPNKNTSFAHAFISYCRRGAPDKKFTARNTDGGVRIWRTQ